MPAVHRGSGRREVAPGGYDVLRGSGRLELGVCESPSSLPVCERKPR